ncbi:uncharacterized protein LOC143445205 [Clavelina lepadiformis]|uniref:uncharacterized protein LOC143445205 n=1 Tax=Clavelina lepadiformis TaxID=159417 RepID=UPI004041E576
MSMLCLEEKTTPSMLRRQRRREKSRDAARCRRTKESHTFDEICDTIPIAQDVVNHLDKSAVMRLVISYIKLRRSLAGGKCTVTNKLPDVKKEFRYDPVTDDDYVNALNAFILVLSDELDVLFVSDNVKEYLGLSKLDVIGQSILSFTHEGDHDEIRNCFKKSEEKELWQTFFLRMKSALTINGKSINLKSASYKVLRCSGVVHTDSAQPYFVAHVEPIPHPANIEHFLDSKTFVTQHSPDMKFTYCDDRISALLDYTEGDMLGRSFFDYCHALDIKSIQDFFQKLYRLNQIETDQYRFLSKTGGYHWIVTQATVINNQKNHTPQCVVCVHYVISGAIHSEVALSIDQWTSSQNICALPFTDLQSTESYDVDEVEAVSDAEDLFKPQAEKEPEKDDCSMVPLIFLQVDENDDVYNCPEIFHNAPSIGDPYTESDSLVPEKLEDLFSDVVVGCDIQGSTAVNNTVTDGGTSVFFPNPARLPADNIGRANNFQEGQRTLSDNRSDSHLTSSGSSTPLGSLSPCDSAYGGSPLHGLETCDQQPNYRKSNPIDFSSILDPNFKPPCYQAINVASDKYQEHIRNLKTGLIEAPPDWPVANREKGQLKHKLRAPILPVPEPLKRRCYDSSGTMLPRQTQISPVKQPASALSELLLPGNSFGFHNSEPKQVSTSFLLQPEMSFTGKAGLQIARNLSSNCLPELSLQDCEVNAPLFNVGYLPLASDCVHALDDEL